MNDVVLQAPGNVMLEEVIEERKAAFRFINNGETYLTIFADGEVVVAPHLGKNELMIEVMRTLNSIGRIWVWGDSAPKLPDQSVLDLLLLEDDIRREADISRGMNENPAIRDKLLEFADRLNKGMMALEHPNEKS